MTNKKGQNRTTGGIAIVIIIFLLGAYLYYNFVYKPLPNYSCPTPTIDKNNIITASFNRQSDMPLPDSLYFNIIHSDEIAVRLYPNNQSLTLNSEAPVGMIAESYAVDHNVKSVTPQFSISGSRAGTNSYSVIMLLEYIYNNETKVACNNSIIYPYQG